MRIYFGKMLSAVTHGRAPDDSVLSQFCEKPYKVRAEVYAARLQWVPYPL